MQLRRLTLAAVIPLLLASPLTADEKTAVTYEQVRPVLKKHCVSCHGQERARGELNLATTDGIKAGSSSGPVAVAGKPDESLLYTLAAHLEGPKMPPGAPKIPQRELDLIRRWIEDGLKEPAMTATPKENMPAAKPMSGIVPVTPLARPTAVTALAISPSNGSIAVSGQQQVVVFDSGGKLPAKAFPFPEGEVFALRFSRDGELLLAGGGVGGESGKVVGIEVATGRRVFAVGAETDAVLGFDLSPDRSLVALGGPGKAVKIHQTADGKLISTLTKHTDWILSLAFSPDGLLLASADRFGGLQVWEAKTGKPFHALRGHVGAVNAISWAADSERLLSAGQDGTLRLWEMHQGAQLKVWDAAIGGILSAEWTAANQIVAGGRGRKVAVFDGEGHALRAWSMPDEVTRLAASQTGERLIAADAAGHMLAWNVSTGMPEGEFSLPLATTAAQTNFVPPQRRQRATATLPPQPAAGATAGNDLAATREALAAAEAAVKSAEESLAKLKTSAAKLKQLVNTQEAAGRNR